MTQKVNPSQGRPAEAFKTAGAIGYAGGSSAGDRSGFITETPSEISQVDPDVDETVLNSFEQTSGGNSFDVTISPGEAFIGGAWLCIDTSTTVSLQLNTVGQTVFVGWDQTATNDVVIGLDAAFADSRSDIDFRVPLFRFDTNSNGVTSVTDLRQIGQRIDPSAARVSDELGVPLYADTTNAPQQQGNVIVVDGSGTQAAGLYSHNGTSYVKAGNTDESVQDIVAGLLTAGANINVNYDDTNDSLLIEGTSAGSFVDDDSDGIAELDSSLNGMQLQDDTTIVFGSDSDISVEYDSANDDLRWRDKTNTADRMLLDRSTGDVTITGTFTENTSL